MPENARGCTEMPNNAQPRSRSACARLVVLEIVHEKAREGTEAHY